MLRTRLVYSSKKALQVPALAVYAVPKTVDDLMRRGSSDRSRLPEDEIAKVTSDPVLRNRIEQLFQLTRARFDGHAAWFRTFAAHARVIEVSAPHFLFITHQAEVASLTEGFVSSLSPR